MFLTDVQPVYYTDPWNSPYGDRIKALCKGHKRVAYYYEAPDNSTFRYRVYNMIQALQNTRDGISAAYFTENEIDMLDRIIDIADILVVCRSKYNHKLNRIITMARNKGKKVFYDIDDMVFDPSYAHLVVNTLDQDLNHPNLWNVWFAYFSRLGTLMSLCDAVITTNEYLAQCIAGYMNKPVFIIPNFINQEQMEMSSTIIQYKRSMNFKRNDQIHLGYFSGTPTHTKDLEIVSDALVKLFDRDPRIVLRVVGFMDLKEPLKRYKSRIEFSPLTDFINLQRLVGEVEINLVPLQDNKFTNCKSELKYFEAGIVGTVSIATPVFTYAQAIKDHENGYLVRSFEWYDVINDCINDIASYHVMAEKSFSDSKERYAWFNQGELIERTLFGKITT